MGVVVKESDMPKDEVISEGGQLMDPAGQDFQTMLEAAKAKGLEQLTNTKPDTSIDGKTPKDEKEPASSAEGKPKEDEQVDEGDTEDVDKLKNSIKGLKAELTRVRNQRSTSEGEVNDLKERLARMEGRLEEIKETNHSTSAQDGLKRLTPEKLTELDTAYEDELADARAVARLAERDGDRDAIAEANKRISDARRMRTAIKLEKDRRVEEQSSSRRSAADEQAALGSELEALFTDVYSVAPELADKDSELWKAGQAEYKKLPNLTKKLGPLGELIATAAAIAKNPHLIGKKATEKILDQLEGVADKAFNKGGTAPRSGSKQNYSINTKQDALDFEEQVRRVKNG